MPTVDPRSHRVVEDLAAADAPDLIQEARAAARARVRAALEDDLVAELLKAVAQPESIEVGPVPDSRPAPDERGVPDEPVAPAEPAVAAEQSAADQQGDVFWMYCVVPSEGAAELAACLEGIEHGGSVEAVVDGHLAALVSRVPLAKYGDDQLRRNLEDIAWLERTARAHEAVQDGAMRLGPLVPLRMCTIYRDLHGVRRVLADQAELFTENLATVTDCAEWGIKVFLDRQRTPADSPAEPEPASASGADYLAGRQRERDRIGEADELCLRCTEEVHGAVCAIARQERVNPVQRAEAHGRDVEMVLNQACLLEDSRLKNYRPWSRSCPRAGHVTAYWSS